MSSPCLIDLSSNFIPVDEEEEEEETYDDFEELATSTLPMLPKASQISRQGGGGGGGQEALDAEEDGDDIYEMLPGKRVSQCKQRPGWSLSVEAPSVPWRSAYHSPPFMQEF